ADRFFEVLNLLHFGIISIEAVNQMDADAVLLKDRRNAQQANRFDPEVIGCEIMDPGVYQ
ncbi:MAG: hypothetical protein GY850_43990, partial [bacterium]|nr:hypothetical protein [bacterium]